MSSPASIYRKAARFIFSGMQETVWSTRPLGIEKSQKILRVYDRNARVIKKFHSWNCQAFEVLFNGRRCVAKFAGTDFGWKHTLRREAANIRELARLGVNAPELVLVETSRLRYPFFVMLHAGDPESDHQDIEYRKKYWDAESALIRSFPEVAPKGKIRVKPLGDSRISAMREVERLASTLGTLNIDPRTYTEAFDNYKDLISSPDWSIGQWQAPAILYNGNNFTSIDWNDLMMIPPYRWIADYTLYKLVNKPETGMLKIDHMIKTLWGDSNIEMHRKAINVCHQYKSIRDGAALVLLENNWDYFDKIHMHIHGHPVPVSTPKRRDYGR